MTRHPQATHPHHPGGHHPTDTDPRHHDHELHVLDADAHGRVRATVRHGHLLTSVRHDPLLGWRCAACHASTCEHVQRVADALTNTTPGKPPHADHDTTPTTQGQGGGAVPRTQRADHDPRHSGVPSLRPETIRPGGSS